MQEILKRNLCTGCTACMNICPKNAISMEVDKEGFKYPIIDQSKCINCGLCLKTCPVLNTTNNKAINDCYVSYTKDEKYKNNSSSGGIFPLIADSILKQKGIVIGASFNEENKLEHLAITKEEDLDKLKGSKYIQSDLKNIFKYVKENISNRKILFVGVPCQIAGLKAYLKKEYDNLYCIDLICHGVPSPKLFEKYIKELEEVNHQKLINYDFRDKSTGWDTYSIKATFENNEFKELAKNNNYSKLFLSNIALRESCYNCKFKLGNKYSDITLGDFWGVTNYYPEMYNKKGVSAIIINTAKGQEIFNSLKEQIIFNECELEKIVNGNQSLKKSSLKPQKRDDFFKNIDSYNIEKLTKKYLKKKNIFIRVLMKIRKKLGSK